MKAFFLFKGRRITQENKITEKKVADRSFHLNRKTGRKVDKW